MSLNFPKYFSEHYVGRIWIMMIDVAASVVASLIVFAGVDFFVPFIGSKIFYLILAGVSMVASVVSVLSLRTYAGAIRHTTMAEIWRLFVAAMFKALVVFVVIFSLGTNCSFALPSAKLIMIVILDLLVTTLFLIAIRACVSLVYKEFLVKISTEYANNVLIYGDSIESVSVFSMIEKGKDYICRGFVVYSTKSSYRKSLCGYPVIPVGSEKAFERSLLSMGIDAIVFPDYKSVRDEQNRMVEYCAKHGIQVLILPKVNQLNEGETIMPPIREVKIEDLLGRDEVEINLEEIRQFLTDKVVLVTGAAGSIGGELCRQLLNIPLQQLILFDAAETPMNDMMLELREVAPKIEKKFIIGDVRQQPKLEYIFKRYNPNVVFHAAAYKHVPMMESNPVEAVNTNVFGTKNVADMAVRYGVEKFVMISTDKAVNPANVMGASKRIAEIYTQSLSRAIAAGEVKGITKFVTTRFGNVLGSNGSVIPLFKKQIAEGGPVTVTDPRIIRYFMTIPEACRLVMEAATMGREDEIFVFDMGDPVKIDDLARNMISLSGLELGKDIEIKYVGLRPGEKLYEELLSNEENTVPTVHKKIFLAKVRSYKYADVIESLSELKACCQEMGKEETVAIMKKIVPEFKSSNSRYGRLDSKQ